MDTPAEFGLKKVPEVTLVFWIIKIAATTLGETTGDALSMTMKLDYILSTGIFAIFFILTASSQIAAKKFYPFLYWAVIVATTTLGTTMADFADRSLGIGYLGGSLILSALLLLSLGLWWLTLGSVSVSNITSPAQEAFYWITILFSNTLGTSLGDCIAATSGLGYEGGSLIFAAGIALLALAYYRTTISPTLLFWSAFILTRPLGATLGDLLTKPLADGGLHLSRIMSSLVLAVFMTGTIFLAQKRMLERFDRLAVSRIVRS